MKRFLYLFFSQWQWARQLHGGRWVRRRSEDADWVKWNGLLGEHLTWPLPDKDYEMESYP